MWDPPAAQEALLRLTLRLLTQPARCPPDGPQWLDVVGAQLVVLGRSPCPAVRAIAARGWFPKHPDGRLAQGKSRNLNYFAASLCRGWCQWESIWGF